MLGNCYVLASWSHKIHKDAFWWILVWLKFSYRRFQTCSYLLLFFAKKHTQILFYVLSYLKVAKQNLSCHQTIYHRKCFIVKWSNICSMQAYKLNNYANESYLETFLHHSCDKYWTFTINRQICTYVNNCTKALKCITIYVKGIVFVSSARRSSTTVYRQSYWQKFESIPLKPLEMILAKILTECLIRCSLIAELTSRKNAWLNACLMADGPLIYLLLIFEISSSWNRFLNLIFCLFRTGFLQTRQTVKIKFVIKRKNQFCELEISKIKCR